MAMAIEQGNNLALPYESSGLGLGAGTLQVSNRAARRQVEERARGSRDRDPSAFVNVGRG
jgi:hypothetical protein